MDGATHWRCSSAADAGDDPGAQAAQACPASLIAVVGATLVVGCSIWATARAWQCWARCRRLPRPSLPPDYPDDLRPVLLARWRWRWWRLPIPACCRTYAARMGTPPTPTRRWWRWAWPTWRRASSRASPSAAAFVAHAGGGGGRRPHAADGGRRRYCHCRAVLLVAAPNRCTTCLTALAAVVIASAIGLFEVNDRGASIASSAGEFWLSMACFAGVALLGRFGHRAGHRHHAVIEFLLGRLAPIRPCWAPTGLGLPRHHALPRGTAHPGLVISSAGMRRSSCQCGSSSTARR